MHEGIKVCEGITVHEEITVHEDRPWVAEIEREIAALEALDREGTQRLNTQRLNTQRSRTQQAGAAESAAAVYTLRLDRDEIDALTRRAELLGLRPAVLARNFIRIGLSGSASAPISAAVGRLEGAVGELRALLS